MQSILMVEVFMVNIILISISVLKKNKGVKAIIKLPKKCKVESSAQMHFV